MGTKHVLRELYGLEQALDGARGKALVKNSQSTALIAAN
jgi:hypothetical protein